MSGANFPAIADEQKTGDVHDYRGSGGTIPVKGQMSGANFPAVAGDGCVHKPVKLNP